MKRTKIGSSITIMAILILMMSLSVFGETIEIAGGVWSGLTAEEWLEQDQIPKASIINLTQFNEAPMLAERVAALELPPVEERLPNDPVVVNPVDTIGKYGGTLNRVYGAGMRVSDLIIRFGQGFFKYDRDTISTLGPNMAKDWEWSEDGKTVTFSFVEGIKWSDGAPLTTDDFMFWWEDIILDERLPYVPPIGMHIEGEPIQVTQIDDYTLQFTYPEVDAFALVSFNRFDDQRSFRPRHYLEQYHPKYNPSLKEDEVGELIARIDNVWDYPDTPTHYPWMLVEYSPGERRVFERNPYYYKVDPEGNQLPYIDRIVSRQVGDMEMAVLHAIEGRIDFQVRDWSLADLPLLLERQEEGGYRVEFFNSVQVATGALLIPGYDYPDDAVREIIFDQNFRRALTHGIDRERINEVIFHGLLTPRAGYMSRFSPITQTPEGEKIHDEWESAFVDYDPEKAKALLDEAGLIDVTGDGWRDRPDGEPFTFYIDAHADRLQSIDVLDLTVENWRDIGIRAEINPLSSTAIAARTEAGEYMMYAFPGGAYHGLAIGGEHLVPVRIAAYTLHPLASKYFQTSGTQGIPPRTEFFKELQDLFVSVTRTADEAQRNELELEIYRKHIEHGPLIITIVGNPVAPAVINLDLKNVNDFHLMHTISLNCPGVSNPEQWFFDH